MNNPLKTLFTYLGKANSEGNGTPSNIRVIIMYVVFIWSTAIAVGIIVTIFYYRELWLAVLSVVLTGIFTMLGVKAYQKKQEEPSKTEGAQ